MTIATSESTNSSEQQKQLSEEDIQQKRLDELDNAELAPKADLKLLFDTLTHCAEPADSDAILTRIKNEAGPESTPLSISPTSSLASKEQAAAEKEHSQGKYRVKFDGRSYPVKHHTWPESFQLRVNEEEKYFYVLQSEQAQPVDEDQVWPTAFAPDDLKTRIGEFGHRYECDDRARDQDGNLTGEVDNEIKFNYAEHKMMGEILQLKWPKNETTLGTIEFALPNGVKLSYGEINGLGGDFFGGYNPVSSGQDLEQQCKYFREAFDTLGNSNGAKWQVQQLVNGRKEEVDAIAKAVDGGASTFQAYKALKKPAFAGLSEDDLKDTAKTLLGDGPSYLRLAQINFDHFGKDATAAYNAGHYCALQTAAEGKLELAYAMNAFADHYLGDCFASGHFRTPRRTLHGSTKVLGAAWDAVTGMLQSVAAGNRITDGVMKVMAPDLLAMLMHNEDNKRGITVVNKQGQKFTIWGDKQLFEAQNQKNKEMMRQALQASVNEVYDAYESKRAKQPLEGSGYRAWEYAPAKVVDAESHSPLFIEYELSWTEKLRGYWPVKVREPFDNPQATRYKPIGGSAALIELYQKINSSELWKTY